MGKESDFPLAGKMGQLMGVGIAANGDVWIADGSKNQLYFFPGGRVKDQKVVKVPGLKSPFDIVIDDQNRVWVANSQADFVTRFPANDPSKVETFQVGLTVRGLALDSKGNVWVKMVSLVTTKCHRFRMARPSWNSFGSWETPCSARRRPPAWST